MRCGIFTCLALVSWSVVWSSSSHASVLLYDASLVNRPGDQSWLVYADNAVLPGTSINQTVVPGVGTRLTSNHDGSGGYSNIDPFSGSFKNTSFPILDRRRGFAIEFALLVHSESHENSNRAGFSVTVITEDLLGIELAFWDDLIWAQSDSPLFTQAEGVAFDTTANLTNYSLLLEGDGYHLSAEGNLLLEGTLRDYSGFNAPPYTLRNFLFLGDNTTSAGADVTLGTIRLTVIPEPASLFLRSFAIVIGSVTCLARRRLGTGRRSRGLRKTGRLNQSHIDGRPHLQGRGR